MTALAPDLASLRRFVPTSPGGSAVAVVMTMGALHEGHAALMRTARERVGPSGRVVVTIFVNPLQFGPGEDFARYPRTREDDLARCAAEGVDVVYAPSVQEVYPRTPRVRVDAGPLGAELEGAARPGHFDGVLTVVLGLLHRVRPGLACFGQKDYQQLELVRAMVADLALDVEIVGVPTVREPDGLALSSRNRYLDAAGRALAARVPRALHAGAEAAGGGPEAVLAAARAVLDGIEPDYLELRAPDLGPAQPGGPARLLAAVRIGATRLIDNVALVLGDPR